MFSEFQRTDTRKVMFKCPGACGSQFVWAAGSFAASRKNHMAACCPQLIIGGNAGGMGGGRGGGEGGRGAREARMLRASQRGRDRAFLKSPLYCGFM
jgi:hypothetical protein